MSPAGCQACLAALSAAVATALLLGPAPATAAPVPMSAGVAGVEPGGVRRWRPLLALLGGVGAWAFVGGVGGLVLAPVAGVLTWVAVGRIEPAETRRARERVARELPHLVRLLGIALTSGAPPADALEVVADALPGPAADRVRPVAVRLRLGADPAAGWSALGTDPMLAPLGRALARAEDGGISVATAIGRLADELAGRARAEAER